jgi:hypothetical protein
MRKAILYSFTLFVAAFFMFGCSNDLPTRPEKTESHKTKVPTSSSKQTNIASQITKVRFSETGYFEVKTEAERQDAEKLLPASISGQNPKPASRQSLKPNVESGEAEPLRPGDPLWEAWTNVISYNGYDLLHESTSSSTVTIDYIDVFHTFYKNGQLVGYGFDYESPGNYATVGRLETGIGTPGFLWEAYGDHFFEDDYYWPYYWNPQTYDYTVQ